MDQGVFEGMTFKELMAHDRDFLKQWKANPASVTMPNGESFRDVQERAWPVIEKIIAGSEDALVVSHNFTIAAILCKVQNISLNEFRKALRGHGLQNDYPGWQGDLRNRSPEQPEPFGRDGCIPYRSLNPTS